MMRMVGVRISEDDDGDMTMMVMVVVVVDGWMDKAIGVNGISKKVYEEES